MLKKRNEFLPKISIVIPSLNKTKYIKSTLDSIFTQSYNNLEIIIQDGGSTDGTIEAIREYSSKYKNIIWESKEDGGQLNAVNKGLGKASGDILTFINADDCYFSDTFRIISETYLKNPGALWFVGCGIVVDEKDRKIAKPITLYKNLLKFVNNYNLLLMTNYLMQPSVFFTKQAYQKYGPFTGTKDFIMEYEFWLKLGKISMPILINSDLSRFRIEASTKTKLMFQQLLEEDTKIVNKYTSNQLILNLHHINNLGRKFIGRFV